MTLLLLFQGTPEVIVVPVKEPEGGSLSFTRNQNYVVGLESDRFNKISMTIQCRSIKRAKIIFQSRISSENKRRIPLFIRYGNSGVTKSILSNKSELVKPLTTNLIQPVDYNGEHRTDLLHQVTKSIQQIITQSSVEHQTQQQKIKLNTNKNHGGKHGVTLINKDMIIRVIKAIRHGKSI